MNRILQSMTELIIKSDRPEAARAEITAAIEGQRRFVQAGVEKTRSRLRQLEKQYSLTTEQLLSKAEQKSFEDNNLDFHDWIGEAKTLELLEDELKLLEEIRIC